MSQVQAETQEETVATLRERFRDFARLRCHELLTRPIMWASSFAGAELELLSLLEAWRVVYGELPDLVKERHNALLETLQGGTKYATVADIVFEYRSAPADVWREHMKGLIVECVPL